MLNKRSLKQGELYYWPEEPRSVDPALGLAHPIPRPNLYLAANNFASITESDDEKPPASSSSSSFTSSTSSENLSLYPSHSHSQASDVSSVATLEDTYTPVSCTTCTTTPISWPAASGLPSPYAHVSGQPEYTAWVNPYYSPEFGTSMSTTDCSFHGLPLVDHDQDQDQYPSPESPLFFHSCSDSGFSKDHQHQHHQHQTMPHSHAHAHAHLHSHPHQNVNITQFELPTVEGPYHENITYRYNRPTHHIASTHLNVPGAATHLPQDQISMNVPMNMNMNMSIRALPYHSDTQNAFLIECKRRGLSYKDIKRIGGFKEAESTLRGRFRTLTKSKDQRVRKPQWLEKDIQLLCEAVNNASSDSFSCKRTPRSYGSFCRLKSGAQPPRISWKKVAQYIWAHGGSYHFGNATCKKKWCEIHNVSFDAQG